MKRLRKTRGNRKIELRRELAKVQRGIKQGFGFIVEGDADPRSVATTIRNLKALKTKLQNDLKKVDASAQIDICLNVPELYRRKVGALQGLPGVPTRNIVLG